MLLRLLRTTTHGNALCGKLYIDGQPFCATLENAVKAIPTGFYPVRVTMSPLWKELLPILDNVPRRTGIRIHPGNTANDSEGCILVGEQDTDGDISRQHGTTCIVRSRATFNALRDQLLTIQRTHETIYIEIL